MSPYERDRATWVLGVWRGRVVYRGVIKRAYTFVAVWVCPHRHRTRGAALACGARAFTRIQRHGGV